MNIYKNILDNINCTCLTIGILFVLFLIPFVLFKAITADDSIQYCYISESDSNNTKTISGFREWGPNIKVSSIKDIDEGIQIAEKLKCPLLKK
jgi:hypothetical protein